MGLKEAGLRGSLRSVSTDVGIPDSVAVQHDATEEDSTGTISTIEDLVGNFDLSGSCEVIDNGINGLRTYHFDGTDGEFMQQTSKIADAPDDEPFAFIAVVELPRTGTDNILFDGGNDQNFILQDNGNDEWRFYRETFSWDDSTTDTVTTDPSIVELIGDNNDEVFFRVNGGTLRGPNTDSNAGDLTGHTLAKTAGDSRDEMELDIGQFEILVDYDEAELTERREAMADKWEIPI